MNLRNPELQFLDLLAPWNLAIFVIGFLISWLILTALEWAGWTRFIWNLPLFFLGLLALIASTLGIIFHP